MMVRSTADTRPLSYNIYISDQYIFDDTFTIFIFIIYINTKKIHTHTSLILHTNYIHDKYNKIQTHTQVKMSFTL